jgi:hypothetical protein
VHDVTALGAPTASGHGRVRRPRLSWLRALPALTRHVTATMPWTTLITGCVAGTAVLAVVAHFAGSSHWQLSQAAVRYAFLPAVAALAYVPRAPFRPLTIATAIPSWVGTAGHVLLASPLVAATCWAQLGIMAHTIAPSAAGSAAAVYPLIAQLTGWCLLAVAAAACVDRSRYADLGGAVAAPVGLTVIALAWYAPASKRFLVEPPAAAHIVTVAWYAIATAALALTCVAMRDHWHRYTRSIRWH